MAERTAFITGATGFLGQNLCEQLAEAGGWRIVALHRGGSRLELLERLGVELVEGDLLDLDSLALAIPDGADAVFHMAAVTSMWRREALLQHRVNVDGTRNVVKAMSLAGAGRLIHTSTWNVFDRTGGPMTEETPKTGRDSWISYDRSKHLAEDVVLDAVRDGGLDAVITNPSHIIGRHDRNNWARLVLLAAVGKLPGVPPGAGDFAHGEEVARGHIAAFERGRTGQNYLLAGPHMSFLDLVQRVAKMARQPKVPKKPVPGFVLRTLGRFEQAISGITGRMPDVTPEAAALVCSDMHSASTRAQDELGYAPPPVEAALEDCYRWLMKAGILKS